VWGVWGTFDIPQTALVATLDTYDLYPGHNYFLIKKKIEIFFFLYFQVKYLPVFLLLKLLFLSCLILSMLVSMIPLFRAVFQGQHF
jgi:hypothetical protein